MKKYNKIKLLMAVITVIVISVFVTEIIQAQTRGDNRRTRRRTAIVVSSIKEGEQQEAEQKHQAEVKELEEQNKQDKQKYEEELKRLEEQNKKTTNNTNTGKLPVGTIVSTLPNGYVALQVGDVEYYKCGEDYYRAAYQGSNVVYVTTDPPK
jgi:flagellar motility protein MotE (MotC chaperone)